MNEEWRDIKDYEGLYQVSNLGNVKSLARDSFRGEIRNGIRAEHLLSQTISGNGYYAVKLCKNGKSNTYMVHQLVATYFISNPENKPIVDHINRDKLCNIASNLRWATYTENNLNMEHSLNGVKAMVEKTSKQVLCVETGMIYKSISEAQRQTGAHHISDVCLGKRHTAGGYHWEYVG